LCTGRGLSVASIKSTPEASEPPVIVGLEPVVLTNLGINGPTSSSPSSSSRCRQPAVAPVLPPEIGRRNQSAVSSELFPSFTRRSSPTGIPDGGRRSASPTLPGFCADVSRPTTQQKISWRKSAPSRIHTNEALHWLVDNAVCSSQIRVGQARLTGEGFVVL